MQFWLQVVRAVDSVTRFGQISIQCQTTLAILKGFIGFWQIFIAYFVKVYTLLGKYLLLKMAEYKKLSSHLVTLPFDAQPARKKTLNF